eukprot:TRINITY_DN3613_c0_g1_i2.p1 TRINITY_DN3613_c0_g1~~TRINITY_DN3613_c0_g1_i2.p1  ORF type:complete len:877 (+),score=261.82 TRINITY_DN3613_c0_g1_i2:61-2691(+)
MFLLTRQFSRSGGKTIGKTFNSSRISKKYNLNLYKNSSVSFNSLQNIQKLSTNHYLRPFRSFNQTKSMRTTIESHSSSSSSPPPLKDVKDIVTYSTEDITKPLIDDRNYRYLRLRENGLKVLLISDPNCDKSAACMNVGVGHLSDPVDFPGLAHFLEHMLFLGTEKYPTDTGLSEFLALRGGSSNAFTSTENTSYHFDILPKDFEEGMDRFAQFFTAPLFQPLAVEREVNAVDSENQKNLQNDAFRFYQLQKSLSNPQHPFSKFGTGNRKTLLEHKIEESGGDLQKATALLRQELVAFHKRYYTQDKMALVVYGRESLDVLQGWVVDKFQSLSDVSEGEKVEKVEKSTPFPPNTKFSGRIIRVEPVKDIRQLRFFFEIKSLRPFYDKNPSKLVSKLVGHESGGSILSLLKKKGWASELSSGLARRNHDFDLFSIDVSLTKEGIEHCEEIMEIVFQYFKLIKEKGIEDWIHEEAIRMDEIFFRFLSKKEPSRTAEDLASLLHHFSPKDVLINEKFPSLFDKKLILEEIMDKLTPQNANIFIVGKGVVKNEDRFEKWYNTKYSEEEMNQELVNKLVSVANNTDLFLPEVNEFIPSDLSILCPQGESTPKDPNLVKNDKFVRLWHKLDSIFRVPRGTFYLSLYSPYINASAENLVTTALLIELLEDSMNEYSYYALLGGLSCGANTYPTKVTFYSKGYSQKMGNLAIKLFERLRSFKIPNDRFLLFKEQFTRRYANQRLDPPYRHAQNSWDLLLRNKRWPVEDKEEALKNITLESLQNFLDNIFLKKIFIEGLVHGNVKENEATSVLETIQQILKVEPLNESEFYDDRVIKLERGKSYLLREALPNPSETNSAIFNFYQVRYLSYSHFFDLMIPLSDWT